MARKVNFAAYVRETMPHVRDCDVAISKSCRHESRYAIPYRLDVYCICGIIKETIGKPILGDRGARQKRQQASQGPGPARRGRAESGAGEGPGSEVPLWRVLRCARHRAGQVRDAAPCFGGEGVGRQCDPGIRRVKAHVLSDQGQLPGRGNRRPVTWEAGSARTAQTAGRSTGVYPQARGCWPAHSRPPDGQADPEEIRSRCPPEDDRAGSRSKKNRTLTPDGGESWERLTGVVPQYEALRNAAFGQALPPEARSGLLLFLRRGMLGWARVMATAGPSP